MSRDAGRAGLRRLPAALGLIAVLGAAGCTGSGPPAASGSGRVSGSTTPSQASAPAPAGVAVRPAALAATLRTALAGVRTVHLGLATTVGTETVPGTGDISLAGGTVSELRLRQTLPAGLGEIQVVVAGGVTYAKLPSSLTRTAKPWVTLSAGSNKPIIAQLAQMIGPILAIISPTTVTDLVAAASSAQKIGARAYLLVPSRSTSGSVQLAAGAPVELSLDGSGRPSRVRGTLTAAGERLTPTISFSDYDKPVTISAPPGNEVDAG